MSDKTPEQRTRDRRQGDAGYKGEERRQGERRAPTPPPKPAG